MTDIEINPNDLEHSAGTLSRLGQQLAGGGQKLQTTGQSLINAASQDESGFGAAITRVFGHGVEITGKVFTEGGGWLSRAGTHMHGNATNHRINEAEQTSRFQSIMDGEPDKPGTQRRTPTTHEQEQQRLRDQLGVPNPDSDYILREPPQPHVKHPGLMPGSAKYDELTGGRKPLTGTEEAEFDGRWSNGRDPNTGLQDYQFPTQEFGHPNGFNEPADKQAEWVPTGTRIDRFGGPRGGFLASEGAQWPSRALPPYTLNSPYHVYEVAKPFPAYVGPAAPWFDQPGKGTQYFLGANHTVLNLLEHGFLREVTGEYS